MEADIQQLRTIHEHAEQNHWSEVILLSEDFLRTHPNHVSVLEVYAWALSHTGQTVQAIEVYQNALVYGMPLIDVLDGVGTAFIIQKKL